MFINTLPFRVNINPETKLIDCLKDVQHTLHARYPFENTPLVDIQSCSEITFKDSLFDSIVVIENYPLDKVINEQDYPLKVNSYSTVEMTNFDLTLAVIPFEKTTLHFNYNQDIFEQKTIERLANHFVNILTAIVQNPDLTVANLEMLSPTELESLLYDFNQTAAAYQQRRPSASFSKNR